MTLITRRTALLGLVGTAAAVAATPASALVQITVGGGNFTPLPIAIPDFASSDPDFGRQIADIVRVRLKDVEERLSQKKIGIEFSDDAIEWMAKKGYDPVYGARPLKRVIQSEVLNPLSKELISGTFKAGDTVRVEADGDKLKLAKGPQLRKVAN